MDNKKNKEKVIIWDIDGCLLDVEPIFREIYDLGIKGSNNRWKYFYKNCNSDRVKANDGIRFLFHSLRYSAKPINSIIVTARSEKCKWETLSKLSDENILCDKIYMRKINDFRPAEEVKRDYLVEIMADYDIVAFFDDEIKNCKMAKDLGIASFRVV